MQHVHRPGAGQPPAHVREDLRHGRHELRRPRLAKVRKEFSKARLCDADQVAVIFLVADDPKKYNEYAVAEAAPPMARRQFLAKAAAPLRRLA